MAISDTSPRELDVYFQRLAAMTPAERVNIGVALCQAGDSLQRAAMRLQHSEADDEEIS
jgi:hypothetical protein